MAEKKTIQRLAGASDPKDLGKVLTDLPEKQGQLRIFSATLGSPQHAS
jgi:hypothetical protein